MARGKTTLPHFDLTLSLDRKVKQFSLKESEQDGVLQDFYQLFLIISVLLLFLFENICTYICIRMYDYMYLKITVVYTQSHLVRDSFVFCFACLCIQQLIQRNLNTVSNFLLLTPAPPPDQVYTNILFRKLLLVLHDFFFLFFSFNFSSLLIFLSQNFLFY